jgi:hypothetical protein
MKNATPNLGQGVAISSTLINNAMYVCIRKQLLRSL